MKKIFTSLLFAALLAQTACLGSIIKNSVKDTPLGNKFLLHSNPRVGDFAILKGAGGNSQIEMKITGRSGGLFIVRTKTGFMLPGIGMRNAVTIDVYVSRGGKVYKGFYIDGAEKTPLKVAGPGENEYMQPVRLTAAQKREFDLTYSETTGVGTFRVRPVAYKSMKNGRETYIVHMDNPRVKFRHVAGYTFSRDGSTWQKTKALELIQQGRR